MWIKRSEAARGRRAAAELRKIADLLERVKVDPDGKPHPEIATIAENLKVIRIEMGKTVKARGLSDDSRRAIADGFTDIGKALRTARTGAPARRK
ncbi:MAG TPA: hypothetical protein VGV88_01305 [Candidatus Dormibacteraeota bacterium]|nr:hypothetical protein [Candidatus Dormibacteraeota bacterium]